MSQCYGHILYNSVLIGATATYTGTVQAGFEQAYAIDWLDYTGFRLVVPASSSVTATWTFTGGVSIQALAFLLRPVSGGALTIAAKKGGTTLASWSYDPTDPATHCRMSVLDAAVAFTTGQALDLLVTNALGASATVDIRELAAGLPLVLETGQRSGLPRMANRFGQVLSYSMTVNGSFVGRDLIRREKSASLAQDYASEAWIAASWAPFVSHAERSAFFWCWHLAASVGGVRAGLDPVLAVASSIGAVENRSPAPLLTTSMSIACIDGFTSGGAA
jgi:hypothetical protein